MEPSADGVKTLKFHQQGSHTASSGLDSAGETNPASGFLALLVTSRWSRSSTPALPYEATARRMGTHWTADA
jgi:hypothetical protein